MRRKRFHVKKELNENKLHLIIHTKQIDLLPVIPEHKTNQYISDQYHKSYD